MSVALLVENPPDNTRLVPVATERVFTEYWQPACSALNLKWVPCFQTGIELAQEDLPLVVEELAQLKCWIESAQNEELAPVKSRIENLISELGQLRGTTAKIWIG